MTPLAWLAVICALAIISGSIWLIRIWKRNPRQTPNPLLLPPPPAGMPPLLYRPDPVYISWIQTTPPRHRPGQGRTHFTGTQCPASHAALARRQQVTGSAHNTPRVYRRFA